MKNKKTSVIVMLLLTVLVLYLVFKDNFTEKVHYLFSFNPFWLLISFLLIIFYWCFKGLALYNCVYQVKKDFKRKDGIMLMITTQFFHAITPFASGGQPWQIYKLKKSGVSLGDSTNIVIEDFIAYQCALILLGVFAVVSNYIFKIIPSDNSFKYLVLMGFLLNILVVLLLFVISFSKTCNRIIVKGSLGFLRKINVLKDDSLEKKSLKFISDFHRGAVTLFKNKLVLFKMVFLNLFALAILYSIPFTLMLGLDKFINPFYVLVTSAYVMLIDSIVPTPGSTGGLEYGFMSFFKYFISGSKLSIIMIVWRIVTYYFGIIVGLVFINIHKEESR